MMSNSNCGIGLQRRTFTQFGRKLVLGTRHKWPRPKRDRDEFIVWKDFVCVRWRVNEEATGHAVCLELMAYTVFQELR